jgi:hypothetical protein
MKTPCYECSERKLGCHSTCDRYNAFRKRQDEKNNKLRDKCIAREYELNRHYRLHRRRGDYMDPKHGR